MARFSITPAVAAKSKDLSHAEFRLLAILGCYASSETGWCWPSNRILAADMGINERKVQIYLAKLQGLGFIQRRQRSGKSAETRVKMDIDTPIDAVCGGDPESQGSVKGGDSQSQGGVTLRVTHNDSLNVPRDSEPSLNSEPGLQTQSPVSDNVSKTGPCVPAVSGRPKTAGRRPRKAIAEKMIEVFNRICGDVLPHAGLTDRRIQVLHLRLKDHFADDGTLWRRFCERVSASDFLSGRKADFRASLDWIIKPANMAKIMEGNYDNRANGNSIAAEADRILEGDADWQAHGPSYPDDGIGPSHQSDSAGEAGAGHSGNGQGLLCFSDSDHDRGY